MFSHNLISRNIISRRVGAWLCLIVLATFAVEVTAQNTAAPVRAEKTSLTKSNSAAPRRASLDPFTEFEVESERGVTASLDFERTPLDKKASAKAQVVLRGRTLLVRMQAKDMPFPQTFGVPRYALWAYIPNYQVKLYIGDLPIRPTSKDRGVSDSAYRYTVLPEGATFGGLMLTAEPIRYTPIVNEALRPLLVGLTPDADLNLAVAATTVYAGTAEDARRARGPNDATTIPSAPNASDTPASNSSNANRPNADKQSETKPAKPNNRPRSTKP